MSPTARCTARDRNGHRCNQRRHRNARHSAFGREWHTAEKRRPNEPRHTTAGWSRTGMTITRAEHRARRVAA